MSSSDVNSVILIGRIVRDVELAHTISGTAVAKFSIANNYCYGSGDNRKETVSFFNCVAWAKGGEIINEYCKKGDRICVMGRLQQRSWEDKDGNKRSAVEVVVDQFQFLSSKGEKKESASEKVNDAFGGDENLPF